MRALLRTFGWILLASSVALFGLAVVAPQPAEACITGTENCPPADVHDDGDDPDVSDGNTDGQITTDTTSCSVYANGGGMGMYCTTFGGGNAKTLRERFGDQKLQQCRYSELPPTVKAPYNANPDEGRYMLMTCLDNIDFDTYNGGGDRSLSLSVVFVPNGTDIKDRDNGITNFLWNQAGGNKPMPVPFMLTRPNRTPIVGIPTYFTFQWLDPISKNVVAEGPYQGHANGGAYRQITTGDVVMRAEATKVVIDPQQKGIKSVTCVPDAPYREGVSPSKQPADACSIIFPRSSASARKYATKPIPANIKDAFYADVTVTWQVTYGEEGGEMHTLGNGFVMRMRQVLPVQEVQAPNQPPAVIY
jgi:hypothetical protein